MRRSRVAIVCSLCTLAALGLGFVVGVRFGERVGQLAEEPGRGWLAVNALKDIKAGELVEPRLIYELDVDRGLLSLHRFDDDATVKFIGSLLLSNPRSDVWAPPHRKARDQYG